MELNLLIHNIGGVASTVLLIGLAFFSYFKNPRKTANVTLALTLLATAVFYVSHLIGVNESDPLTSRNALMFLLSIIWVGVFLNHCVLSLLDKAKSRWFVIAAVYFVGLGFTAFFVRFPDSFLLPSIPKLYFPNYYVPGASHNLFRITFNFIVPFYFIGEIIASYFKSGLEMRNRLKYFLTALILGYGGGFMMVFLIYDVPIDPNWGVLFAFFFAIPFVYAVVKYELLDIKVIAKRALGYGFLVVLVSLLLTLVGFVNDTLVALNPGFPGWLVPILASILAVAVGVVVWNRMKEVDILKYEFIAVVTHKFRTPLTHIKWSAESLALSNNLEERKQAVEEILNSNSRLVELTNTLIGLSKDEGVSYLYKFEKIQPRKLIDNSLESLTYRIKKKHIVLHIKEHVTSQIYGDFRRLSFALGIILENAVMYTPTGGTIEVGACQDGRQILLSVKDSGVGIPGDELPYLFTKFFRGSKAKTIDTEGLGIGLFMAKTIAEKNDGKLEVASEGQGKGATFTLRLKAVK